MKSQLTQIFSILFMLCVLATIVVFFATDKNMKATWIVGVCAIVLYFLYRFSKR